MGRGGWGDVEVELNLCRTRILGTLSNHSHILAPREGRVNLEATCNPPGKVPKQLTLSIRQSHDIMISFK